MGTHCFIGVENPNKTIDAVYCHYDGYLIGVGKMLLEHHNSETAARALIAEGDLSGLDDNDGSPRREEVSKPQAFRSATRYVWWARNQGGAEFAYLWTGGQWQMMPLPCDVKLPTPAFAPYEKELARAWAQYQSRVAELEKENPCNS